MREIKFRAWDKENKAFMPSEGYAICDGDVMGLRYGNEMEDVLTDQIELMQYTSLDDVNGNPIYEGDIVKAYRMCKNDLITFDNGSFGIAPDDLHSFKSFTDFYGKCEVIGNKFENPELLEAEK